MVEEAATDVIALEQAHGIAEPWTRPGFIDSVITLQRERQLRASRQSDAVQFHDRCGACTAALAAYLGYSFSDTLSRELDRILKEEIYQKRVFFLRNLGFIKATEARRITFEETLRFEQIHEETYRKLGFELVYVEPGTVEDRSAVIKAAAFAS